MNNSAPAPPYRLEPEHLRGLLVHVDAEEISMRNAMRLLESLPVQTMDSNHHREMKTRIEQSLEHIALLSQNRQKVIRALAQRTGLAMENVCFTALLPFASPAATALIIPARQRLNKLVRQLRVLTNSALWIIGESRRIQFTIMDSISGQMSSDRYDSNGNRQMNAGAFRYETRS